MSTILAILQNQWFKNPERIAEIYAKHATTPEDRADLNARFLFAGSMTGRRLKAVFGDAIEGIVWEEASRETTGQSNGCPPADLEHIASVINHFKPSVVLAFGKVAQWGVARIESTDGSDRHYRVIKGPHPAARHPTVMDELRAMAAKLAAPASPEGRA